jgi:DNA repair exonuclease SbcCD ATPase subunit
MKIDSCEFKNFGSYGNRTITLELPQDPGFFLVQGRNGHGKSTLSDVIKFGIFGKLENKKMKDIPNRLNKHTEIKICLTTRRGKVIIERGLEPGYFRLFLDGKLIDKAGKRSVQEYLEEELLEMPFYVFSNTLSLSINDFKSFIRMSNFDKRAIIDKIFGLQILNKMRDTLKSQSKKLREEIDKMGSAANAYMRTLKSSEHELQDLQSKILEAQGDLLSKLNDKKILLERYIIRGKDKERDINAKLYESRDAKKAVEKSLSGVIAYEKELNKQIRLYENSQCPVCSSDLNTDFHKENLKVLRENLDKCKENTEEHNKNLLKIEKIIEKIDAASKEVLKQVNTAETQLSMSNNQILKLTQNTDISQQTQSLQKIVKEAKSNIVNSNREKFIAEKKVNFYSLVEEILGEKGIKQLAIRSILPSLNAEIQRLITMLGLEHRIMFDEEFNAKIIHFGAEVSADTLSTGESKKVDFAVLLAIVRLMKLKYPGVNLIFLDEIFSSIDGDGIYHILKILRETVKEFQMNIFVISHYPLTYTEFDYKLEISKSKGFSSFEVEKVT